MSLIIIVLYFTYSKDIRPLYKLKLLKTLRIGSKETI